MRLAVDNKVMNFDQAWSILHNLPIPIKPTSPITDATYGNDLTALYPGKSAKMAAMLAYMWKGAPTGMIIYDVDKLGYLELEQNTNYYHLLFSVNPADVQIATKANVSPFTIVYVPPKPPQLLPDKLYCVNEECYDSDTYLVGRAPASILAKENMVDGPMQHVSTQATITAASPATSAGDDDGWPKMTPCIQKLDDAFVKDTQAKGIDSSVSADQMQEWASTCKALGQ